MMRVVMVPPQLVNLLREVLVEEVTNCAEEIKDPGRSHPDFGIVDPQELGEVYQALLEQVVRYARHRRSRSSWACAVGMPRSVEGRAVPTGGV